MRTFVYILAVVNALGYVDHIHVRKCIFDPNCWYFETQRPKKRFFRFEIKWKDVCDQYRLVSIFVDQLVLTIKIASNVLVRDSRADYRLTSENINFHSLFFFRNNERPWNNLPKKIDGRRFLLVINKVSPGLLAELILYS